MRTKAGRRESRVATLISHKQKVLTNAAASELSRRDPTQSPTSQFQAQGIIRAGVQSPTGVEASRANVTAEALSDIQTECIMQTALLVSAHAEITTEVPPNIHVECIVGRGIEEAVKVEILEDIRVLKCAEI